MTSVISLNKRRVLNFFTFTLKKQTPLTVLVTAFALLFCPGTLLSQIMERIANYGIGTDKAPHMESYFLGYSIGIFVVGIGLSLLLTATNFSFLYSKKSGDVFHALPLTRTELLTVRMASSFIGGLFTMTLAFASLALINIMPGVISVPAGTVLSVYAAMVLMLAMLVIFTTVFIVCSGGIFDFAIAILGINIAIPLLYLIFHNILDNNAYGVVYRIENWVKYTSPFVFAVFIVLEIAEMGALDAFENYFTTHGTVNIVDTVIFIVFTALCVYAVYKLFNIRRSETAGEAYSFSFMPHIISVLVSVVGGYAIAYIFTGNGFTNFDFWVFFVIGTVLCSVSAGAIFTRGFKTVKSSMLRGVAALGLTVLLVITLVFVGASHEKFIPKAESIEKITVGYNEDVEFTDNFDIVIDIHKMVFDNIGEKDSEYNDKEFYCIADEFDSIRMKYYLKNGRVTERQYFGLVDPAFDPLFIRYAKTDEYIKRYLDFEGIDKLVELQFSDYEGENIDHTTRPLHAGVSPDVTIKLATAYAEEFKNAPESAFYESCDILSVYGMNSTSYSVEMRIPESFTKTREILSLITFNEDVEEELKIKFED